MTHGNFWWNLRRGKRKFEFVPVVARKVKFVTFNRKAGFVDAVFGVCIDSENIKHGDGKGGVCL